MTTWTTLREEDKGEAFDVGTVKGKNGTYPTWWPPPFKGRDGTLLETLHGFPYLTWWGVEKENLFPQFPKMTITTFEPPSDALLASMPRIQQLEDIWANEASKLIGKGAEWVNKIGKPMAEFWDADRDAIGKKLWEPYLIRNCKQQLQFFGVPVYKGEGILQGNDNVYNSNSNYFKKSLVYYPGRWTLMVNFTLMILITRQIRLYPGHPFIPWRELNGLGGDSESQKSGGGFSYPIMDWIRNRDLPQIKLTADALRGRGSNVWSNVSPAGLGFGFSGNVLRSLSWFRLFYESGGFSSLKNEWIYFLFQGPLIISFAEIVTLSRVKAPFGLAVWLTQIDKPTTILGASYVNSKTCVNWMLWALAIMYIDLKEGNENLWEQFVKIEINIEEYNSFYIGRLNHLSQSIADDKTFQEHRKTPVQKIISEISQTVIPAITPGGSASDQYGPSIDTFIITGSNNGELNSFLNEFRGNWRKTALFNVFGIGDQKWPIVINAELDKDDVYELDIYNFIQDNPPRRLRIPPLDLFSFSRLNPKWEDGFKLQFTQYLDWVVKNVKAQKKVNYSAPGTQLKSPEGDYLTIVDPEGNVKPLMNLFPDIMMVDPPAGLQLSTVFSFAFIFIDQIGKAGWGTNWEDAINNFGKKVWVKIKEALVALVNFVGEIVKLLPDIWPYVLALGAGVGIFFVGETFLSEKIKRLAD